MRTRSIRQALTALREALARLGQPPGLGHVVVTYPYPRPDGWSPTYTPPPGEAAPQTVFYFPDNQRDREGRVRSPWTVPLTPPVSSQESDP